MQRDRHVLTEEAQGATRLVERHEAEHGEKLVEAEQVHGGHHVALAQQLVALETLAELNRRGHRHRTRHPFVAAANTLITGAHV